MQSWRAWTSNSLEIQGLPYKWTALLRLIGLMAAMIFSLFREEVRIYMLRWFPVIVNEESTVNVSHRTIVNLYLHLHAIFVLWYDIRFWNHCYLQRFLLPWGAIINSILSRRALHWTSRDLAWYRSSSVLRFPLLAAINRTFKPLCLSIFFHDSAVDRMERGYSIVTVAKAMFPHHMIEQVVRAHLGIHSDQPSRLQTHTEKASLELFWISQRKSSLRCNTTIEMHLILKRKLTARNWLLSNEGTHCNYRKN